MGARNRRGACPSVGGKGERRATASPHSLARAVAGARAVPR